ncbi:MAG: hypothetical protein WKG52_09385 [Variovorax sp.]
MAVRVGQRATLQIEGGGLADPAAGARRVGASVARVNPSAQAGSRSVLVYLRLDGSTGLRQGLFAQGTIDVGRTDALALPLSAVRIDKPAPYVQLVIGGRIATAPCRPAARRRRRPDDGRGRQRCRRRCRGRRRQRRAAARRTAVRLAQATAP